MAFKVLAAFAGSLLLAGCGEDNSDYGKSFLLQVRAEQAVKSSLKDPESVKFENFRYNVKSKVVCGEYNARNGFGGMTGNKGFYFWDPVIIFEEADADAYLKAYAGCGYTLSRESLDRTQPAN
ncbi:MAG: hypothetical protein ACTMKV_01915 [Sphingomonas parapaucimobilis]